MEDLTFFKYGTKFLSYAVPYGILRSSTYITNLIGYFYIGLYNDEKLTIG